MCRNIFQDILKNDKLCKFPVLWLVIRIPLVIQEEFTSITMYVITICNITYAYGGRSQKHRFHLFQKYTSRKKEERTLLKNYSLNTYKDSSLLHYFSYFNGRSKDNQEIRPKQAKPKKC